MSGVREVQLKDFGKLAYQNAVSVCVQYVAREIMNHSHLLHPHIVQFKEVS
jgi:hypothetical protein